MKPTDENISIVKHPRPAYLQPYLKNKNMIEATLRNTPNANKSSWRNLPKASLSDLKEELEANYCRIENSIVFAFCTNKLEYASSDIIPIRNKVFWDLVRDGDSILISDRNTHHYTTVHSVDTANDLVYLSDPWPNDIFLLPGLNDFGIEAKIENDLVIITRQEFLRVVIGLLTVDNPSFIEYYLNYHPEDNTNYKILHSFGQTLLKHGFKDYVLISVQYLQEVIKILDRNNSNINKLVYIQGYAFANEMAIYISAERGRNKDAAKYQKSFIDICNQYGQEEVLHYYNEVDFYRLGILVANQNNYDAAANYFTRSINVKKDYFKSYLYLALALMHMSYFLDSVNAATNSIYYIDLKFDENQKIISEKNLGVFERAKMLGEQSTLTEDLIKALKIRGDSYQALGNSEKSQDDYDRIRYLKNRSLP